MHWELTHKWIPDRHLFCIAVKWIVSWDSHSSFRLQMQDSEIWWQMWANKMIYTSRYKVNTSIDILLFYLSQSTAHPLRVHICTLLVRIALRASFHPPSSGTGLMNRTTSEEWETGVNQFSLSYFAFFLFYSFLLSSFALYVISVSVPEPESTHTLQGIDRTEV